MSWGDRILAFLLLGDFVVTLAAIVWAEFRIGRPRSSVTPDELERYRADRMPRAAVADPDEDEPDRPAVRMRA